MINLDLNKVFVKLLFFFLHYIAFSFSDRSVCLYLTWKLKKKKTCETRLKLLEQDFGYPTCSTALGNPWVSQPETPLQKNFLLIFPINTQWKRLTVLFFLSFSKAQSSQNFVVESSATRFESWRRVERVVWIYLPMKNGGLIACTKMEPTRT